jgi:hypothetical protein
VILTDPTCAGIPIVSVTVCREITWQVKPSLACSVGRPFGGLTLGAVGGDGPHEAIVDECWTRPPARSTQVAGATSVQEFPRGFRKAS